MINIRYHIVSITAVFLALGIGVALGSTFLDRATVDLLDRNIRSAENRIQRDQRGERPPHRAARRRPRARRQPDPHRQRGLLADELTDVPVLVVTAARRRTEDADALNLSSSAATPTSAAPCS